MLKDSLLKKIFKNSGIIFFGNSTASVLNFIAFALMAKAAGPESLAIFAIAQTYSLLVNDIFNIHTWESLVKFGLLKLSNDSFSSIVKTNLIIDLISASLAFLLAFLLVSPVSMIIGWDQSYTNIISLYTVTILFNITTLTIGVPRLFGEFSGIAKIQIVMAIIRLVSVFLVSYQEAEFIFYVVVYMGISVLTDIALITFGLLLLNRKLGRKWWASKIIFNKDQIRFIWWTNLRTIIRIPVRHFDIIVISSVISLEMLGFYKVYKEITNIISRISDPINQSIFPEFSNLIGNKESNRSVSVAKKTILLMSCVSLFLTVFLIFTAKFIIGRFFGMQYLAHIDVIYFMLTLSGFVFATTPINSLFIAAGFAKMSFYVVLFTNSIYLLVAFLCGSMWGLYGVVLANAIQMVLNKALKVFLMKKYSTGWSEITR